MSQKNLVGESMRLRMKCNEEEGKIARQKLEFESTKRKALSKGENLAKVGKKIYAAKEESVTSDNVTIRVTYEQNCRVLSFSRGKFIFRKT